MKIPQKVLACGLLSVVMLTTLLGTSTSDAELRDCSAALIPTTTTMAGSELQQLSLAWQLTENAYNEAKKDASGNATIYGVPVGANYGEFKKNVRRRSEELRIERFEHRSFAYATTGLSKESLEAYRSCLASQGGTALVVEQVGDTAYLLWLTHDPGFDPKSTLRGEVSAKINIESGDATALNERLKKHNFANKLDDTFAVRPTNRQAESVFGVRVGSRNKTVILPPIAAPPVTVQKICQIIFASNDNHPSNSRVLMDARQGTHDCARLAQHMQAAGASDVRLGCRRGGEDILAEQRFAITPGAGYDPKLSAQGPPFGPKPNCGWN